MSTLVHNDVTIYSKNRMALEAFRDRVNDEDPLVPTPFSLVKLKPIPKLRGTELVEWCMKNWGTKWETMFGSDGHGVTWHEPDNVTPTHYRLNYRFDTAQNAPWKLFDELKASNPDLSFWWDCVSYDSNFQTIWWSEKGVKACPDPLSDDPGVEDELAALKQECEHELETRH